MSTDLERRLRAARPDQPAFSAAARERARRATLAARSAPKPRGRGGLWRLARPARIALAGVGLAPELARLNEDLEEAAWRDLHRRERLSRQPSRALLGRGRRRAAWVALALALLAGGVAFGVSRVTNTPPEDIVQAASGLGARRPQPRDAIHLGGHTLWVFKGGKGQAVGILGRAPSSPDLTLGCSTFTAKTAIALCGGIQDRGQPSVFVGRVSSAVASVTALYPASRWRSAAVSRGLFVVDGPPAASVDRLGARPRLLIARDDTGRVVGSIHP